MIIPSGTRALTKFALELIADCRVSQGKRAAVYRTYAQWIETGKASGDLALANLLYSHVDKLHSHLFLPTDLRFSVDFEAVYDDEVYKKGDAAAKIITREWERKNIDTTFAGGVRASLVYGACILKQLVMVRGNTVDMGARLTMPWNFGVYNEGENDLHRQEAMCETAYLTKAEVWRRIRHLPDADGLYKKVLKNSSSDDSGGASSSFFHQVLSTAVLDTNLANATQPTPGGVVTLTNNPNYATLGPEVAADLFPMHELYVKDDVTGDYVTIQLIEPDILIAPILKKTNMFCEDTLPYTLIQPNKVEEYFWGRSEIVDLIMLQSDMTKTLDDIRRLMGVQFDKVLGFNGVEGITDEAYDAMRAGGYYNAGQGGSIVDLTPKMPEQSFTYVKQIIELMDMVSGFTGVLSGRGEPGVRAGTHADALMKTASPRLRDRSLLVERACASAADATLSALEAKDGRTYWTDPKNKEGDFLLSQLPEDRRISVDSHSTSPIYADDHQNLVAFGLKTGLVDKEDAIDMLPFPNRDRLKDKAKKREAAQAAFIQQHPELLAPQKGKKAG